MGVLDHCAVSRRVENSLSTHREALAFADFTKLSYHISSFGCIHGAFLAFLMSVVRKQPASVAYLLESHNLSEEIALLASLMVV